MSVALRALLIEDSEDDALLLAQELRRNGYALDLQRVETAETLRAALGSGGWDIIIADYKLPGFTGLAALEIVKSQGLDIPFLLVSGTIGEELAAQAMKAGANDYIMKDRLNRLAPAVARELKEAEVRRERRKAEEALRQQHERLQRQLHFTRALNRMAETIITQEDSQAITAALAEIAGGALGVDRCLIFDVNWTNQDAQALGEWLNPLVVSASPTLSLYDFKTLRCGAQQLWEARTWIESHADAPHPGFSQACGALLHGRMGTASLLWFPFFFRAYGFHMLVFNQTERRRQFREDELSFLESVGKQASLALQKISMLGERRRAEAELLESQARLRRVMSFWDFPEPAAPAPVGPASAPTGGEKPLRPRDTSNPV